ncbi:MAG: hypothetical protein MUF65_12365 [Rubritepida sp.]|nr:hypothetical protein [Rubritepida sp.]MCU0946146.1 hypothetical protein [Rubritepida sp.]
MPQPLRLALATLLLAAPVAAQVASPPSNSNSWQVIRPDGSERRVSANTAEVTDGGGLRFVIRFGSTSFVVQAFAPGEWSCVRALALRGERGETFSAPPAQGC